jgi:hypothetical protein
LVGRGAGKQAAVLRVRVQEAVDHVVVVVDGFADE